MRHRGALIVWGLLALGLALGLFPRALPRGPGALVAGLLALLAALQALSATWSESVDRSLTEALRTPHYLGIVLFASLALSRTTWRSAVAGLTVGAGVVCLLAVLSRLDPTAGQLAAIEEGLPADRTGYPFDYWNALGAWAVATAVLGLGWSVGARRRPGRSLGLALVPLATLTAYITYSRTSIGAVVIAAVVVLVLSAHPLRTLVHLLSAVAASAAVVLIFRQQPELVDGTGTAGAGLVLVILIAACAICAVVAFATAGMPRMPLPAKRRIALGVGVVVLLVAAFTVPAAANRAWDQFRDQPAQGSPEDPTLRLTSLRGNRYLYYGSALDALESDPLRGTGAGTFEFWWTRGGRTTESVQDAHSFVLEAGGELGLPGLILAVALLVAFVGVAARARFRLSSRLDRELAAGLTAVVAVWVVAADVDWMWESTAFTVLSLALIGAVGASGLEGRRPVALQERLALTLVVLGIGALQVPTLLSVSALRDSQADARSSRYEPALTDARRAERWAPWSAEATLQRGLVETELGRFDVARRTLERAAVQEPTNWRIPFGLVSVEGGAGRTQATLAALRRAIKLNPNIERPG